MARSERRARVAIGALATVALVIVVIALGVGEPAPRLELLETECRLRAPAAAEGLRAIELDTPWRGRGGVSGRLERNGRFTGWAGSEGNGLPGNAIDGVLCVDPAVVEPLFARLDAGGAREAEVGATCIVDGPRCATADGLDDVAAALAVAGVRADRDGVPGSLLELWMQLDGSPHVARRRVVVELGADGHVGCLGVGAPARIDDPDHVARWIARQPSPLELLTHWGGAPESVFRGGASLRCDELRVRADEVERDACSAAGAVLASRTVALARSIPACAEALARPSAIVVLE